MPTVDLISMTPNYMALLECACKQPYGKDVTEKSIKKIIESGHLSVLEHCYASFLVTCSVRVLGQLTRHRHLSFTCKSARGVSLIPALSLMACMILLKSMVYLKKLLIL